MKKLLLAGLLSIAVFSAFAQNNWRLNGNMGTSPTDFLGTTDARPVIFKTNGTERGQLLSSGAWRFGTSTDYAGIDVSGNLSFAGTASHLVDGNAYVFRFSANPNYGLFFNSSSQQWDFRNGAGTSVFAVDANDGALFMNGQKFFLNPGNFNLPIGIQALSSNTTGYANIAIGDEAQFSNTTGTLNTATGYQSLSSNTVASENSAYGAVALKYNTTGAQNAAFGSYSLYRNTSGAGNVALGHAAMENNTTGTSNVGVGNAALIGNTIGFGNTAMGQSALGSTGDGWQNTSIGYESLLLNTTGARNTVLGSEALTENLSGSINIGIGVQCDVTYPDLVNAIVIGTSALVDASDKVRIGNTNITSIGGEVSWTTFSDARYKTNIKEDVPGLAFINNLRPITYTVDIAGLNGHYPVSKRSDMEENAAIQALNARIKQSEEEASKIVYTGFAAQEVEEAAQKLNYNFSGIDKPKSRDGLYGLRYSDFVIPLVKAVQEVSADLEAKDEMIADQQKQIDDLKLQLQQIKDMLSKTNSSTAIHSTAVLEQNAPNPFSEGTTIRYELPEGFTSAMIVVTDMTGRTLKQMNVAGAGKGAVNMDASIFSAGTYNYSLYVDQKLIATKQMVLTK